MYGNRWRLTAATLSLAVLAVACGTDDEPAADEPAAASTADDASAASAAVGDDAPATSAAESEERTEVRLAFNPDATLQWMQDEGITQEIEDEFNVDLVETETFEPGPAFLSNRADIISVGTFEIAAIEAETGMKTVTFGQSYNNPYIVVVNADNPAETLADLAGGKVALRSGGSGPLTASVLAGIHDLDLPAEGGAGGDFEVVLTGDHLVNLDLVQRGDVDFTFTLHSLAAPQLREGTLKVLYDGRMVPEILTDEIGDGLEIAWGNNNLVAREDWFDEHPHEVQFLLALYERAAVEWNENREEIVQQFPQEFNVETVEDIAWVLDVYSERDPVPDTAYIDEEFVTAELMIIDLMREIGLLEADSEPPRFETVGRE